MLSVEQQRVLAFGTAVAVFLTVAEVDGLGYVGVMLRHPQTQLPRQLCPGLPRRQSQRVLPDQLTSVRVLEQTGGEGVPVPGEWVTGVGGTVAHFGCP
jgi:hypothetical protein